MRNAFHFALIAVVIGLVALLYVAVTNADDISGNLSVEPSLTHTLGGASSLRESIGTLQTWAISGTTNSQRNYGGF